MEVEKKLDVIHFSHQHVLEITNSHPPASITCYACKLHILSGREFFNCKTCQFSLHQVCYSMPRKTQHPAHPVHHLSLLVSPSYVASSFMCMACGKDIYGFYYNCAECRIYCHVLCSALPLSLTIASHTHTLKLEFLPPYDFCCGLCDKPSYNGWLYRCRFCEFDTHIACAISNQRQQSVPHLCMSPSLARHVNLKTDYGNERNELIQLMMQGVTSDMKDSDAQGSFTSAVVGWDERLHSSKVELNQRSGGIRMIGCSGLSQTKPCETETPSKSGDQSRDQGHSTTLSEDMTTPSYQFSERCFSIDLAKSYSMGTPEVEAKINQNNIVMPNGTVVVSPRAQQLGYTNPGFNPHYRGPENWVNEALILITNGTHYDETLGQNDKKRLESGTAGRPGTGKESNKSEESISSGSCWRTFLTCCYRSKYKKCSKSFKNGGL